MTDTHTEIPLSDLLANCGAGGPDNPVSLPQSWTQGRTCFGGLSSALAYQAASHIEDNLPPIRSAQIAFTGPLQGTLITETNMLRRGRSTAFVEADVSGEKGHGLHCSFIFAAPRETEIRSHRMAEPDFPPIPQAENIRSGPPQFFTSNMEFVGKRIDTSVRTDRLTRWMRLKHREGLDIFAELFCMGDSLPPSIMGMLDKNAMVSSMNWQVNFLTEKPATKNGWWLLDSATHHADAGTSSQYMSIWNSEHELVATGMQSVAYYA